MIATGNIRAINLDKDFVANTTEELEAQMRDYMLGIHPDDRHKYTVTIDE